MTRSEKDAAGAGRRRWYDDACGTAMALELVGERWSLMIVRELMFGARRFGEIRAALPGLSANILTQRLERLEQSGILVKRKLPPPASVQVYELTPWGYESEPIFQTMGRWAVRSPEHDPTLGLSAASLMMSLRTMHNMDRARGYQARVGFVMNEDAFVAEMDEKDIAIERRQVQDTDFTFIGSPPAIAGIIYGKRPIDDAQKAGDVRFEGDRRLAERFVSLFVLPPKWNES